MSVCIGRAIDGRAGAICVNPAAIHAGGVEHETILTVASNDDDTAISAERGDFIGDIDRWVLQASLKLVRDRRAEGRPLRLFVTQSALTLADPAQATWLKSELAAHDVPGNSLVIELRLEDAAIIAATVRAFCDQLVDDGVQTTSQIVDFYPYRDRYAFFGNNSGGIGWASAGARPAQAYWSSFSVKLDSFV